MGTSFADGRHLRHVFSDQSVDRPDFRHGNDGDVCTVGQIHGRWLGTCQAPGWPWVNARIGLQYTYYNKFAGTTVGAHQNNALFLHA
jgi:hypothetical protein